ncbi:PD-(D/E)XK nuclease domain-containing protein [Enterobacter hormaechei]
MNQFLGPFEFFDSNRKETGLLYLENILSGTEFYLNALGITPAKESDVYQPIKQLVNVVFPSSTNASSIFLKPNKQYKPDILVPELKAAIEYKYANSKERLNKNIEEVVSDTQGYTNDANYSFFYAVFYVTQDFIGENRFMETWKQHNFPKNWIPIYIVGH